MNTGFTGVSTRKKDPKKDPMHYLCSKRFTMRYRIKPKYLTHETRKTTSLMVDAYFNGKRILKSTGIIIPLQAWDSKSKTIKKVCKGWPPVEQIRVENDLRRLEALIGESQRAAVIEDRTVTEAELLGLIERFKKGGSAGEPEQKQRKKRQPNLIAYLENFIPTVTSRRNKHAKSDEERITAVTVQQYTQLLPVLKLFRNWTGKSMDLRKVDVAWHDAFLEWGQEVEHMGPATLGKHIKTIKRLFYYAKKDGLEVHTAPLSDEDFDKPRQPKNEVQYLNREELERIKALDLSSEPMLSLERDWLIIGCWTGLRVSDLSRLTEDMIKENAEGERFIHILTQKTRKKVVIPILKDVQDILDRRDGFPKFRAEQLFNRGIKEICKLAEINEPIKAMKTGTVFVDRKDDDGNPYQEEVPRKVAGTFEKWELITTHSCRRSFASNWYGSMPNQVIMGITGHSKEEDFLRYIGVTPEENANRFMALWREQRLKNGLA